MWWHGDSEDVDAKSERQFSNIEVFKHLGPYFSQQTGTMCRAFVLLFLATGASLAGPQILRETVNSAVEGGSEAKIIGLSLLFITVAVSGFLFNYIMTLLVTRSGLEIVTTLKERLFLHVLELPISFFHEYTPGRLLSRVESDTENLKQLFSHAAVKMVSSFFIFVGVISLMMWEDWQTTSGILIILPILAVLMTLAMRVLRFYYKASRKAYAKISSFIAEYVPSVATIQHYNYESRVHEQLEALNAERTSARTKAEIYSYTFWGVFHFMEIMAVISLIAVMAPKVKRGEVDLGTLIMFIEYLRQVFMPLFMISEFVNFVQRAFVSAERVFSLLLMKPDDERFSDTTMDSAPVPKFDKAVRFENVCFSYGEDGDVLHDISFEIKRGETIAVVGPSGGGKTTIANLLLAFYEPRQGRITIDDVDLREYPKASWRRFIGLVLQELQLFPGSLQDNLTVFGSRDNDQGLQRALEVTGADKLVEKMGGLDAPLLERGRNLSQGEKQLISFARALIDDPPLLVLDEATASVDPITERDIQVSLDRMLENRTAFVIAHRLSTIANADRILVIEDGRIVAEGTHEQLLSQGDSAYQRLYELQFGEGSQG